jgi:hypothetical protein
VKAVGYTPIIEAPNLKPLFGAMSPDTAARVNAELLQADAAIVRLAETFGSDERQRYEDVATKNRLGLETTYAPEIDGCISSFASIENADGTTSHGATDLGFTIDTGVVAEGQPRTWIVTIWVAVNCDRRLCPTDPHELLRLSGEATTPLAATALLGSQLADLAQWLANHQDSRWRIFRHNHATP